MASFILTIIHSAQAAFGAYNLYLAYNSITNLQKYEDTSKKLAKYSNVADNQLQKTRATQASGTAAVLVSFLSSVSLLVYGPRNLLGKLAVAGVNFVALGAARDHVGRFWKGKAKVPLPGMGEHNDAVSDTQEVRLNSAYLMGSWVVVAVLGLVL